MKISNETHQKVLAEIKNRLNPDLKIVLLKVLGIHIGSALITLTVCPQMGYSLIESKINLMDLFMKLGPHFCDFACGTFFTSVSVFFIYFILGYDELRALRFRPFLMLSTMILTSLGFLLMLNPQMFVQFTFLWLLGAIIGVVAPMQIGFKILSKSY